MQKTSLSVNTLSTGYVVANGANSLGEKRLAQAKEANQHVET
jgi:hypothetical protein